MVLMNYIFDFETLSTDRINAPIISMAILEFDFVKFTDNKPYEYSELLDNVGLIKFNVEDQVKNHGRKINPDTLKWWGEQSAEARAKLKPSTNDQLLSECIPFISKYIGNTKIDKVFSRGNTFDPIILDYIGLQYSQVIPWEHWQNRDTRSFIDGMAWGTDIKNSFIPEGLESLFIAHDPAHDITMDVMRMQTLVRALEFGAVQA